MHDLAAWINFFFWISLMSLVRRCTQKIKCKIRSSKHTLTMKDAHERQTRERTADLLQFLNLDPNRPEDKALTEAFCKYIQRVFDSAGRDMFHFLRSCSVSWHWGNKIAYCMRRIQRYAVPPTKMLLRPQRVAWTKAAQPPEGPPGRRGVRPGSAGGRGSQARPILCNNSRRAQFKLALWREGRSIRFLKTQPCVLIRQLQRGLALPYLNYETSA